MEDMEKKYQERMKRYTTAIKNERPDSVPVRLFAEEFASKYAGVSNQEAASDYNIAFEVTRKCAQELNVDAAMSNGIVNWLGMSKMIGWKAATFPGLGIPPDYVTQITEPEDEETAFLKADEFGEFAHDPTLFLSEKWLPRFTAHINMAGEKVTHRHNMSLISGAMAFWDYMLAFGKYAGEFRDKAGVVVANAGTLKAPLDLLGDKLRGYLPLCFDLFERRDDVIKACEAMVPHCLRSALSGADPDKNVPVTIWMHRGHMPYISRKDFDEIYWATLKPIIEEIYKAGHQTLLYAEGNWDEGMEVFRELPAGSVIFHVDSTDIIKARDTLGDKFALSGGVGNDILSVGTVQDVQKRCKFILDNVAQDCGYVMDASMLIMDDAKTENVKAMVDYTLENGVFSTSSVYAKADEYDTMPSEYYIKEQSRKPGVCVSWDEFTKDVKSLEGNIEMMKNTWEGVDALGYTFLWTNLTW